MKCNKFQEQITAAVDEALTTEEQQELESHLAICPECKTRFSIESATRNLIRTRCKRVHAPGHVLQNIAAQLETGPNVSRSWFSGLLDSIYFRPAIGFAVACAAIIFLVNNGKRTNVVEASMLPANDVVKQSLLNYAALSRKEIEPQFRSTNADEIQQFFSGKTEFPAFVPTMNGCTPVGGVLNEFAGKTLAHVVFNHHDSDLVYVYEACWETVQKGNPLHLSQEIQDQLRRGEPYVATDPRGYTVVLWQNNSTLCSAVAQLDQGTLLACLNIRK